MARSDLSQYLVHLTKGNTFKNTTPADVLFKILKDKRLIGSTTETGFICGSTPAVCFQDAPLLSVGQNVWYEDRKREQEDQQKIRYNACGLMFRKRFVYGKGGRPVIYDRTEEAKSYIKESDWWRIVKLDLSDSKNIVDWTHEREWRAPGNLDFELENVAIIVPNDTYYRTFVELCLASDIKILEKINGIVNFSWIY